MPQAVGGWSKLKSSSISTGEGGREGGRETRRQGGREGGREGGGEGVRERQETVSIYRIAVKFGGNYIWQIWPFF